MSKRQIQRILGFLTLLGFLSVAVFWSIGMHMGGDHICISAVLQSADCPNASTSEAIAFHLNTPQSLAKSGLHMWQFTSIFLALAFVISAATARFASNPTPGLTIPREGTRSTSPPKAYQRWLSLLEHSPSFSLGRV